MFGVAVGEFREGVDGQVAFLGEERARVADEGRLVHLSPQRHGREKRRVGLDEENRIIGYEYVNIGKLMDAVKNGTDANEALKNATGSYGRFQEAVAAIDPRKE